ncbi:hypothetical protein AB1F87_004019 [Vibrio mimicus]
MKSHRDFELMKWNGTKHGKTPNWSRYDAFEMRPVCEFTNSDGDTFIQAYDGDDLDSSEIIAWTVYGHVANEKIGGVYALHDCNNQEEANTLMTYCESQIQNQSSKLY